MKKSAFIWSVTAGILASLVFAAFELLAWLFGLEPYPVWYVAAGVMLNPEYIVSLTGISLGTSFHLTMGGFWGLIFYVILLFTGKEQSIAKGTVVGYFIMLINFPLLRFGASSYTSFDSVHMLAQYIGHILYGVSLGWLMPRLVPIGITESQSFIYNLLARNMQPAYKPEIRQRCKQEENHELEVRKLSVSKPTKTVRKMKLTRLK